MWLRVFADVRCQVRTEMRMAEARASRWKAPTSGASSGSRQGRPAEADDGGDWRVGLAEAGRLRREERSNIRSVETIRNASKPQAAFTSVERCLLAL